MKKQFRASWLLGLVLCVCLVLGLLGAVAPVEAQAAQTQNVTINMFDCIFNIVKSMETETITMCHVC